MTIELSMKSSKWNLCYIYKPPRIADKVFCDFLSELCEVFVTDAALRLFFGDMNCNLFQHNGIATYMYLVLQIWLSNHRVSKGIPPTLVDVFLTGLRSIHFFQFNSIPIQVGFRIFQFNSIPIQIGFSIFQFNSNSNSFSFNSNSIQFKCYAP